MSFTGSPVAFHVFGLEVRWYAILIVTGMLLAIHIASKEAKRVGLGEETVSDLALLILPAGIIGARLWYVIFEWHRYQDNPLSALDIRSGGLAIHGALLAAAAACYFFCRKRKLSFVKMADLLLPVVALAQAIGRWGNFTNNEAHGGPTDLPWGLWIAGEKVHPTFLYESIGDLCIFLFLWFYIRRHRSFDGQAASLYLILYGILRFFVEGLRTDSLYMGPIRVAQLVSLIGVVCGAVLYFAFRHRAKATD